MKSIDGKREYSPLNSPGEILIVDDEIFIQNAFKLYFETLGYRVRIASNRESALRELEASASRLDVAILDLVMPGCNGIDLLREFKGIDPEVEIIIATGCGSIASAIDAMRNGAFDYITKPIVDFDRELLSVVEDALVRRRGRRLTRTEREGLSTPESLPPAAQQALDLLENLTLFGLECASGEATPGGLLELLEERFGIRAGLYFRRDAAGNLEPPEHWGEVHPLPFEPSWFSDIEAHRAVRDGEFHLVACEDLDLTALGLAGQEGELHPLACHLPVPREAGLADGLLLFFSRNVQAFNQEGVLHNGAPLLLLASLIPGRIDQLAKSPSG